MEPVLAGVITRDAHVEHAKVSRRRVPAEGRQAIDRLAPLAEGVLLRLEVLEWQPLLLVVGDEVDAAWVRLELLEQ